MNDLRASLAFARRIRTCPPERVLKDPSQSENLKKHMQICPDCGVPSALPPNPWMDLLSSLQSIFSSEGAPLQNPPLAGEIRLLRKELGRWHEGLYYTPPAILLLRPLEEDPQAFRAAQVHFDAELAGPGDLVLEPARTGTTELIVECWNSYPVTREQLGSRLGAVSPEVMRAVFALAEDPWNYPDWAVVPPEMSEEDPRLYFRELELEVAHLFARDAVFTVLHSIEERRFHLKSSGSSIAEDLRRIRPLIRLRDGWRSIEEALALADLPPEMFALAAAKETGAIAGANFVVIQDHLVREILPVHVELFPRERKGDLVVVGGRFVDPPQREGELRLLIFLARRDEPLIAPRKIVFDPHSGHFSADFPAEERDGAETRIALLCYRDDD